MRTSREGAERSRRAEKCVLFQPNPVLETIQCRRVSLLLLTLLVGAGGLVELSLLGFCVSDPNQIAPAEYVLIGEPLPFPN